MQDVCIKTSSLHRGKALHGSSEEFSSTLSRAGQPFSASMPLVESGSWKKQVLYNKYGSFGDAKTAIFDEIIGNQNQVSCIQTKYLMYFGIFSNLFGFGVPINSNPHFWCPLPCFSGTNHGFPYTTSRWDWRFRCSNVHFGMIEPDTNLDA